MTFFLLGCVLLSFALSLGTCWRRDTRLLHSAGVGLGQEVRIVAWLVLHRSFGIPKAACSARILDICTLSRVSHASWANLPHISLISSVYSTGDTWLLSIALIDVFNDYRSLGSLTPLVPDCLVPEALCVDGESDELSSDEWHRALDTTEDARARVSCKA